MELHDARDNHKIAFVMAMLGFIGFGLLVSIILASIRIYLMTARPSHLEIELIEIETRGIHKGPKERLLGRSSNP